MKMHPQFRLYFLVGSALLAVLPQLRARQTIMSVVRESGTARIESSEGARAFVAIDGGYIEGGRAFAGEKPPAPDTVRQALLAALGQAGYVPVASEAAPAVVLTYHWGLIQPDPYQPARSDRIQPNLRARMALVVAPRSIETVEDNLSATRLSVVNPEIRDAYELAEDPRYFVIVSAYVTGGDVGERPQLLWRTRFSAQNNAGAAYEVIPALLAAAAPYFGEASDELKRVTIDVTKQPRPPRKQAKPTAPPIPAGFAPLLQRERDEFSGERDPRDV